MEGHGTTCDCTLSVLFNISLSMCFAGSLTWLGTGLQMGSGMGFQTWFGFHVDRGLGQGLR